MCYVNDKLTEGLPALWREADMLRERARQSLHTAQAAFHAGNFLGAEPHFYDALELAEQAVEIGNRDEDWDAFAEVCMTVYHGKENDTEQSAFRQLAEKAKNIWELLLCETGHPNYRRKLEQAGFAEVDRTDYTQTDNYLSRPMNDLYMLAVLPERYDILENDDGEILLAIHGLPGGDVSRALLFCDGTEHALLFKGPYRLIILELLHPAIREKLPLLTEILCCEYKEPNNETTYSVRIIQNSRTGKLAEILLHRFHRLGDKL